LLWSVFTLVPTSLKFITMKYKNKFFNSFELSHYIKHYNKTWLKKTALKIECGSFSHGFGHVRIVDLQFLLQFSTRIFGCMIYRWKGLKNTFPIVYHTPKISSRKLQKKLIARVVGLHKTMDKRTTFNFECGFLFTMFCYSEGLSW